MNRPDRGAARGAALLLCLLAPAASAQESERPWWQPPGGRRLGDTNVRDLGDWDFAFGIQYRFMYNASNIPGPGGSSFGDTDGYDFARQRLRLNFDVKPKDYDAGAHMQFEFRGGSGGTAPGDTDPRSVEPTLNPFNFIDVRGIRFGYLYWDPAPDQRVIGGILPVSDEFGDTLFSADWDWNVAGVALLGETEGSRYRAAVLETVEGVGSLDRTVVDNDGRMIILDYSRPITGSPTDWAFGWGLHLYALLVEEDLPLGGTEQFWFGPTFKAKKYDLTVDAFAMVNTGDLGQGTLDTDGTVISGFGDEDADSHTGYALKLGAQKPVGEDMNLKAFVLHTSGDSDGDVNSRFVTPQGLFGTLGYWGFTHIFTPNGPSDVNDFGLEIGNDGAGLFTLQSVLTKPVTDKVDLHLAGGFFQASEARNGSRDMGYELSLMASCELSGPSRVDVGVAYADLDEFFGPDPDSIYEIFLRWQLQF